MKIAVIGAGRMGHVLAKHLVQAGHDVTVANSRGPETLETVAAETGAKPATVADAIHGADTVFLAMPYFAVDDTAASGDPWMGKLVVDLTNYYEGRDGPELDPGAESSSVVVAGKLPGARVVKAFNTIMWKHLDDEPGLAIFYATDDDEAGDEVAELIGQIGFAPVKSGGLHDGGRRQEPGQELSGKQMTAEEGRAAVASG
jgi:8-hydroxy-5-deazaflavin:NADPH oxidoreductase